mmetsp:Transcript_30107/g.69533  ORF Transcript_30107/g.69533 Transcript_30107/m.69533 type:complete len:209 (+) Transcript_30107:68-694(+)
MHCLQILFESESKRMLQGHRAAGALHGTAGASFGNGEVLPTTPVHRVVPLCPRHLPGLVPPLPLWRSHVQLWTTQVSVGPPSPKLSRLSRRCICEGLEECPMVVLHDHVTMGWVLSAQRNCRQSRRAKAAPVLDFPPIRGTLLLLAPSDVHWPNVVKQGATQLSGFSWLIVPHELPIAHSVAFPHSGNPFAFLHLWLVKIFADPALHF